MHPLLLVLCLLTGWACTASARAQSAPLASWQGASGLDPTFAAALFSAGPVAASAAPLPASGEQLAHPSAETRRQTRRGRWRLATGAGLAVGSVIGFATQGRAEYCSYYQRDMDKTAPRAVAGILGAGGVALMFRGAFMLPRGVSRPRLRTAEAIGMSVVSMALAAMTAGATFAAAVPEMLGCGNT